MNKIVKIIIGLIVILAIIGTIYFVLQKREEAKMGYVQFEDFIKQESNGEIYFENKESGLKFKVPTGWNYLATSWSTVSLKSSDFQPYLNDQARAPIESVGCWIDVIIKNEKENSSYDINYSRIKNDIERQNFVNTEKKTYAVIDVNGTKFLRTDILIDENKDNIGDNILVEFVQKNVVYSFAGYFFGRDKENCSQSFNDFLTTVSIEK